LWLGGNSTLARKRVAKYGFGWAPFLSSTAVAGSARTAAITSIDELGRAIDDVALRLRDSGRDICDVPVLVGGNDAFDWALSPADRLGQLRRLSQVGVTHVVVSFAGLAYNRGLAALSEIASAYSALNEE
jgi:hypothetical protein